MNAITLKWGGIDLHASRDAWFNATEIAEAHGKEVYEWLRLSETKRYIAALCRLETDKEAELKPGKSRNIATPARESQNETPFPPVSPHLTPPPARRPVSRFSVRMASPG